MQFNDYQEKAISTSLYDMESEDIMSVALLLTSEAGEVAGKIDKAYRKANKHNNEMWDNPPFSLDDLQTMEDNLDYQAVEKELGDVIWAVAVIADQLGIKLEDVAKVNINKLASRQQRDVIVGDGDNR